MPEDFHQHQLFADELTTGDISGLIDFDCGERFGFTIEFNASYGDPLTIFQRLEV